MSALDKARAACDSQVALLVWLHSDEGKALPAAERSRVFETLRAELGRNAHTKRPQ